MTSGLLGEQYISLSPGGDSVNLKSGDTLKLTQSAVVLENLIGQFLYNKARRERQKSRNLEADRVARANKLRAALLLAGMLAGCATSGGNPADPFEPLNRVVFSFNDTADKAVIKPVARAYRAVLPGIVRTGVSISFPISRMSGFR